MTIAAVAGTTSWGTTLAVLLARNGLEVRLWARSQEEAFVLQAARENLRHRPGLRFPEGLTVTSDTACFEQADLVLVAAPSERLRENLGRIAGHIGLDATVLSATKGIEAGSQLRMSQVITEAGVEARRVLALSGPNFASEVAGGLPAATVVAGSDQQRTLAVQKLLGSPFFRVYTSEDVIGVELAGALKNVIAIACGAAAGLGLGENARAALITRGLAEMSRLGVAAGANPTTFLGLAGLGDLVLTCGSDLSRNRRLGRSLASGASVEAALASIEGVVEGAATARGLPAFAARHGVEMPICQAVHDVLYERKPLAQAVEDLLTRAARPEF